METSENNNELTFFIPLFAHKQHAGKKAKVLSVTSKKARLRLLEPENSTKTLYVDPAHIEHLLHQS